MVIMTLYLAVRMGRIDLNINNHPDNNLIIRIF